MNLTEALHESAEAIISCTGTHYSPETLQTKKLGVGNAVCNSVPMSDQEKIGRWKLDA